MSIVVTPIPRLTVLTVPAFTLGTSNAAGTVSTAIASNSTILTYDGSLPDAITLGQSGATGSQAVASRRDHAHAMVSFDSSTPDAITFGQSGATGSSTDPSRGDHSHAMVALATQTEVIKAFGTVTSGSLQDDSYNIAGTTLNSTGNYTCTWDTDFSTTNYVTMMVPEAGANRTCTVDNPLDGSITCLTYIASSGALDSNNWQVLATGPQ